LREEAVVAGPIVYVDHSEIVEGKFEEVTRRLGQLADLVEAGEPRIMAYAAYIDPDRTSLSVIHVHADAESLATHFKVAGPAFGGFAELVRLRTIDVFGDPSDDVVDQLRQKAELLGGATVAVHPYAAGFTRGVAAASTA
jgi:hypothetical protein